MPSSPLVPDKKTYPCDDGGELSELLLLVTPEDGHEGPQLRLREHTLEGGLLGGGGGGGGGPWGKWREGHINSSVDLIT